MFCAYGSSVLGAWNCNYLKPGPKVDKSENVSLAFSCVQPIRIFCETMITSLSATTIWTNNVFLLPNINSDQYMYCSMLVFFLLCCSNAPSGLFWFSISLWENYSGTYLSGMYTTSFWVCFSGFVCRYFLRRHHVYGITRENRSDMECSGFVWMSP